MKNINHKVWGQLWSQLTDKIVSQPNESIRRQIRSQVYINLSNHIWDKLHRQTSIQLKTNVRL